MELLASWEKLPAIISKEEVANSHSDPMQMPPTAPKKKDCGTNL